MVNRHARFAVVIGLFVLSTAISPANAQRRNEDLGRPPGVFDCTPESNKALFNAYPRRFIYGGVKATYVDFDQTPQYAEVKIGNRSRHTRYWVMKEDIVPIFGIFYRVSAISTRLPDNVEFRSLSEREIPEGLSVGANSHIFPLRTACSLHRNTIWVDEFMSQDEHSPTRARIYLSPKMKEHFGQRRLLDDKVPHVGKIYAVGDSVTIDVVDVDIGINSHHGARYTHKIDRIAVPDRDRHIPGWLEISGDFKVSYTK